MGKIREGQLQLKWKFAMAIALWVVIAVVIVFGWQNLRRSGEKQVAGEKTTLDATGDATQSPSMTPTPQTTPRTTPTLNPTVEPKQTPGSTVINKPQPEQKAELPDLLSYWGDRLANLRTLFFGKQLNLNQGSVKFNFTYDGGDDDRVLLLGNFSGQDRKDVLVMAFADCTIGFDTFDSNSQEGEDDPNIELGDTCAGKTFDLEFKWNFSTSPPVKRIFVDGELKRESFPKTVPSQVNSQILLGPIQDLVISDEP